jgi:nicotinamide-nucleotide amidase
MIAPLTEAGARQVIERIRFRLKAYFDKYELTYAVFGKSEGLDSSVIAGLLSDIPGIRPVGVVMPIESRPEVREIAHEVLAHFGIPAVETDLADQYQALRMHYTGSDGVEAQVRRIVAAHGDAEPAAHLSAEDRVALGNIKARLRMITLYHLAKRLGGVVISTDNYSEYWMGFWTLCGDVGDIAPIQQIFKGAELYTVARVLGVPASSLNAPPSDGLGVTPNSHDEEQLGMPYVQLDEVIALLLQADYLAQTPAARAETVRGIGTTLGIDEGKVASVAGRMVSTEFKRRWPLMFTRAEIGLPPV